MKKPTLLVLLLCVLMSAFAQTPMKSFVNQPHDPPQPIRLTQGLPSISCQARQAAGFDPKTVSTIPPISNSVAAIQVTSSGSFWIRLKENNLWASKTPIAEVMSEIMHGAGEMRSPQTQWEVVSKNLDETSVEHVRIRQTFAGYPIARQDMILHLRKGELRDLNGYAWTGPLPGSVTPRPEAAAMNAARAYLRKMQIAFQSTPGPGQDLRLPDDASLCWYPAGGSLKLAYQISMHPNLLDSWKLYVDASTLDVLEAYSELCAIFPAQLHPNMHTTAPQYRHFNISIEAKPEVLTPAMIFDGATTVMDQDLLGQNRLVNAYLVGTHYYMIDASRVPMYSASQSVMPDSPVGVIWTIDGQNRSPQQSNFEVVQVTNSNNNWKPLEVSAHYDAGQSYEYFLTKFNRNSLNGNGGNIISIINITDENGNNLDNAFWGGTAMFYGNGDVAFKPLARGLDVAGHEMSHGVVQNTAGLEYIAQSGALNESFADVFGSMIDRDDWQIGEDVVNLAFFPSGALRDLSDPHNGGTGPNDNGWQPQHMNEYQNLPNTPDGDNGGVHINSGIPNKAFFLFATSIGKDKAEQVYYKALRDYLVKSSRFIDMRNAVIQAAGDLYGSDGAEVNAAKSAFDGVGIGVGQGGDYQHDIDTNPGDDFILATDAPESDLYWIPPDNPSQYVKLNVPAPLSRPSFTDDGTAAVYVNQQNDMILLTFDWSQGLSYNAFYLEQNPQGIWRNVVVSKDGSKIAYTTSQLMNEIWIYDFGSDNSRKLTLYNPTTAYGIVTGDVLYSDAMEWDYSGNTSCMMP